VRIFRTKVRSKPNAKQRKDFCTKNAHKNIDEIDSRSHRAPQLIFVTLQSFFINKNLILHLYCISRGIKNDKIWKVQNLKICGLRSKIFSKFGLRGKSLSGYLHYKACFWN